MTPNIFDSTDYRQFLKDLYLSHKEKDRRYSYRKFAQEFGFKPSNFLHLVVAGKRSLSLEAVKKIQNNLNLSAQAKKYFYHLVQFNQTKNSEEKNTAYEEMQRILGKRRTTLKPEQHHLFSRWFLPVLKEVVTMKGFVSNLNWISKKIRPRVSEDLIKQGLEILERLKIVEYKNGQWKQLCEHVSTENDITSEEVSRYHANVLDQAKKALKYPLQDRDISAMTMGLSKSQFAALKQRMVDFKNEIQQELQSAPQENEMVAQLNIQLYPVTE